jgi:hypothetical protein
MPAPKTIPLGILILSMNKVIMMLRLEKLGIMDYKEGN